MTTEFIVDAGWLLVASAALLALVAFVAADRQVSLRIPRWCALGCVCLLLRLLLAASGTMWQTTWDQIMTAGCGGTTLLLIPWYRYWLLRATSAQVCEQIEQATRGLFLRCDQKKTGEYVLIARDIQDRLSLRTITHQVQAMQLPGCQVGKMGLLRQWFSKQYPGPLPRLTITLSRGPS